VGLADALTPAARSGTYTQAIMDLGPRYALAPARPARCARWPTASPAHGDPARFPLRKPRHRFPERRCQLLVIRNADGAVLLEKRPPHGIWGGLWSFPEVPAHEDAALACDRIVRVTPLATRRGTPFRHTFSHFRLEPRRCSWTWARCARTCWKTSA
jgi:A/G-specific adenine glycosylase